MNSVEIFTLGFVVGIMIGGMVAIFLMCCFILNGDEDEHS